MKSPLTEPTDCMPQAPHVEETTAQNCIVCGSGVDHRTAMACGQDYEYETCRNHWRMWKCNHCSHVQLDPRPADSALAIIYPRNYYSYNMSENVSAFAMKCKALLDRVKFSSILSSPARQPESYLDVGCGDGRYLRLMMDRGLPFEKVQGLEIDPEAVERAAQKGLNAKCMRVEDADHIADESLDLITMFHVIEHLGSPRTVVATLVRKLKPGGVLVVETPNFESLDARIFYKRFWGGYHFPRHWHIFTPSSVERLLKNEGLELQSIKYQPGHAFWLFSLHHLFKYKYHLSSAARRIHPLHNIPALALVVAFDLFRSSLGLNTSAMLVTAVKPNRSE